jgi:hypothetical protein
MTLGFLRECTMRKLRSASLASTSINEHATKAKTEDCSE